jgi:hypothetical protein
VGGVEFLFRSGIGGCFWGVVGATDESHT